jgi:hypothetical protein
MVSSSSGQQPEEVLADPNPILYREVRRKHPVRGMENFQGGLYQILGSGRRRLVVYPNRTILATDGTPELSTATA